MTRGSSPCMAGSVLRGRATSYRTTAARASPWKHHVAVRGFPIPSRSDLMNCVEAVVPEEFEHEMAGRSGQGFLSPSAPARDLSTWIGETIDGTRRCRGP